MNKVEPKVQALTFEEITQLIAPHTEFVLVAPWNGQPIPVTIRMLDSVTLNACGDFNVITAVLEDTVKDKPEVSQEAIIKTKNIHENILRYALVHPTFDEFEEHLKQKDFYVKTKAKIEEIEALIKQLTSAVEQKKYQDILDTLELSIAFLLPEDFTATIVSVIMQRDASDIKKLTKEALLRVGLLAEKYNVRPSSYLEGTFTEKQNEDIDISAVSIVHEYREMQKIEQQGKMRWIRGKSR